MNQLTTQSKFLSSIWVNLYLKYFQRNYLIIGLYVCWFWLKKLYVYLSFKETQVTLI